MVLQVWSLDQQHQRHLRQILRPYQRTEALGRWCWRRVLRVPWTTRRSNQSIFREINPAHSSEGLMLKLQCFGHLTQRADSLEKSFLLGKTEGRRDDQRMRWLDGIINAMGINLGKLREMVRNREAWRTLAHEITKSWTRLSN